MVGSSSGSGNKRNAFREIMAKSSWRSSTASKLETPKQSDLQSPPPNKENEDPERQSNRENWVPEQEPEEFNMRNFKGRPSSCVFVASLSSTETDDNLSVSITKHFEKWGKLVMVKVLRDNANRPYAFVQYNNDAAAKKALIEAQNSLLNGRAIRCEAARVNRTVFVKASGGKLISETEVRDQLGIFGEIEHLVGMETYKKQEQEQREAHKEFNSSWFCMFAYRDDAVRAYANLRSQDKWIVEWAQNVRTVNEKSKIDRRAIYIGQLDHRVTRKDLLKRFSQHGRIITLDIVSKPTHTIAFIRFETEEAAASALERENHSILLSKTMHVQYRDMNHISEKNRKPVLTLAPPPVNIPLVDSLAKERTELASQITKAADEQSKKSSYNCAVHNPLKNAKIIPIDYKDENSAALFAQNENAAAPAAAGEGLGSPLSTMRTSFSNVEGDGHSSPGSTTGPSMTTSFAKMSLAVQNPSNYCYYTPANSLPDDYYYKYGYSTVPPTPIAPPPPMPQLPIFTTNSYPQAQHYAGPPYSRVDSKKKS